MQQVQLRHSIDHIARHPPTSVSIHLILTAAINNFVFRLPIYRYRRLIDYYYTFNSSSSCRVTYTSSPWLLRPRVNLHCMPTGGRASLHPPFLPAAARARALLELLPFPARVLRPPRSVVVYVAAALAASI